LRQQLTNRQILFKLGFGAADHGAALTYEVQINVLIFRPVERLKEEAKKSAE
jgi:hypothetical protein